MVLGLMELRMDLQWRYDLDHVLSLSHIHIVNTKSWRICFDYVCIKILESDTPKLFLVFLFNELVAPDTDFFSFILLVPGNGSV